MGSARRADLSAGSGSRGAGSLRDAVIVLVGGDVVFGCLVQRGLRTARRFIGFVGEVWKVLLSLEYPGVRPRVSVALGFTVGVVLIATHAHAPHSCSAGKK